MGIYLNDKNRKYSMQGIICLGSKSFEDFMDETEKISTFKSYRINKIDISD
jgi:hypothetical protein